jgi:hypothetical protein
VRSSVFRALGPVAHLGLPCSDPRCVCAVTPCGDMAQPPCNSSSRQGWKPRVGLGKGGTQQLRQVFVQTTAGMMEHLRVKGMKGLHVRNDV